MRHQYKDLVGDPSSAANLCEEKLIVFQLCFELEEPGLMYDFRDRFNGRQSKFEIFWEKANEYVQENIGTAVDDRTHSEVVHLAKAFSVRYLREQIMKKCPAETPFPCDEWIRLQFSPHCATFRKSLRDTGGLKIKHKVQQRQWRKITLIHTM